MKKIKNLVKKGGVADIVTLMVIVGLVIALIIAVVVPMVNKVEDNEVETGEAMTAINEYSTGRLDKGDTKEELNALR